MVFRERSVIEQREEFVLLALAPGANVSELARRFEIARSKAHKWIRRYREHGLSGLGDRSRRPKSSPKQSCEAMEARVLAVRAESNNAWGGRKIAKALQRQGLGDVPAPSTITAILRRHGKLEEHAHEHPGPHQRFEHAAPNDLWQMDFKGHFALKSGRCHPLTAIDDHSRYALCLEACGQETEATVKQRLSEVFRRYGLPRRILCDNGSPWGSAGEAYYTGFAVWIIRLGIGLSHGRPFHPQTQGKEERFHRSLKAEAISGRLFDGLEDCQAAFDKWRNRYNHERPHQALALEVPASRYQVSPRPFPATLPDIDYGEGAILRIVNAAGCISFENRSWCAGRGFVGEPLGLRPRKDGRFAVFYCAHELGEIDSALLRKGGSSPLIKPERVDRYPHNPQVIHSQNTSNKQPEQ